MPLFGPPNIEKLKSKRDVQGLIKALADKAPQVRQDAVHALGELADFLSIPQGDVGGQGHDWPGKWPGKLRAGVSPGLLTASLEGDEILISTPLSTGLELERTEKGYKIRSHRERELLSRLGIKDTYQTTWLLGSPPWSTLALLITDRRAVAIYIKAACWSSPLQALQRMRLEDRLQLLTLDFGDDEPITFRVNTGGATTTDIHREEVPQWVEQTNKLLDLLRTNASEFGLFLQSSKAERRGGFAALAALVARLNDQDGQVRADAVQALEKIGGPKAENALAQYRAHNAG